MTQEHPITPPPELIEKWHSNSPMDRSVTVATQAARWGADQELEACCEWLETGPYDFSIEAIAPSMTKRLRAARRPKPPSLAEEAQKALAHLLRHSSTELGSETIRRALERLQELELRDSRSLAEPQPEPPANDGMIPDCHLGYENQIYRDGFHAGYRLALTRVDLAKTQPEPPTDEELDELFAEIDQSGESESWRAYARAVLVRWGA